MAFYLNLSLAKKFMISLLLVGIIPMLIISQLALSSASSAMHQQVQNQLSSIRDIKSSAIERYFAQARAQVTSLASLPDTRAAMQILATDIGTLESEYTAQSSLPEQSAEGLRAYYKDGFLRRFEELNSGQTVAVTALIDRVQPLGQLLQRLYISGNANAIGSKHLLDSTGLDLQYDKDHAKFHPAFRDFLEGFGLYDIFLVDATTGNIVYTVFKELDFGTNLVDGPYADTALGKVFRQGLALKQDETVIQDYEAYLPSYNAAASFIATPIFSGETRIGVLIFQLPLEPINAIMTERTGMGTTGESYLVGPDFRMRSDSYLDPVNHSVAASFRNPENGSVRTEAATRGLAGESGSAVITDYTGNRVLSAYSAVDIEQFKWALLAEIDEAEAFASINALRKTTLISMLVAAVAISLLAWFNSSLLTRPIMALSNCIQRVQREGSFKHRVDVKQSDEIGVTARMFNSLMDEIGKAIASTNRVLQALSSEKYDIGIEGAFAGDLGELVKGVNDAADQIRVANVTLRDQSDAANESARVAKQTAEEIRISAHNALIIKQALNSADTCTMIFDPGFKVYYANESMMKLIDQKRETFRAMGVDGARLIGLDVADMARSNVVLNQLIYDKVRSASADCSFGKVSFTVHATAILDEQGRFVGKILEWHDRTVEIAIENEIDDLVKAAATGDFRQLLEIDNKKGFILNVSHGLNKLVATTRDALQEVMEVFSSLSQGDLTCRIERDYEGDFATLKRDANATIDKLNDVVNGIASASGLIASSASEISAGIYDLNKRTEQQASSLQETTACIDMMESTVGTNLGSAQRGSEVASTSFRFAQEGSESVQKSVAAMQEIERSSDQIASIVSVIDGIAFQTNLLALNAAVEAARAGDQGKGFAVVATEVRQLAQRSASAAREIKTLIGTSVQKVRGGTALVNSSGQTLNLMVGEIQEVSSMMGDLMKSAQEQASGITQVKQAIDRMDTITQHNVALVEEASAASENMAARAREMNELVAFFKRESDTRKRKKEQEASPLLPLKFALKKK